MIVQQIQKPYADLRKFGLDLGSVVIDECDVEFVVVVPICLLDRRHSLTCVVPKRANHVLVGREKEVALLESEVAADDDELLHEFRRLLVALYFSGELCHLKVLVSD
ncbi:hypothetical protein U1Q18_027555 [Sarracenia purpurea var. burkii]